MFDAGKTKMIGLPYGEKNYDNMLSHFHLIPERHGQTDRQIDLLYQYRASMCWRVMKNQHTQKTIEKTKLPWLTRPGNGVAYSIQARDHMCQATG